ncbi:MAG: serine/threonine protein kinase [Acidobacteria bacterium]|nr:serine/threonine protein kinase [Acidobacteriota bacterium]MBI3426177.1 serine/threonine protein kinase [Acidobacteriota bacterium]
MTPERWQQIKDLVNSAIAADAATRSAVLQQSCADDLPLRLGAEALLSFHEDATRRLAHAPAVDLVLNSQMPLSPDRWQQVEQVFQSALELEPAARAAFLAKACGADAGLRHEVESLLVYQAAAGDLIGGAIQQAAGLLANEPSEKTRFTPGTTLNKRYRIIGLLGRGGMGEVYRADDLKLGHPVALKFLTEKLSNDKTMLARFHSEVSMAHRVTHPNVCRVHDIGDVTTSSGNLHFLSMEYVDGEDLSSLLRRIGRLPSDKAVEIANQLCAGLAAAHEAGVLHRDLKPANVMLDGKGRVRITDFGLAGFAEQIKGSEVMAGTPAYMSPEQFAGKEVTTKSDIYALGLVLYEIFTGKRVFEAGSLAELQKMHESSAPTNPSSWVKDIDPLVERVILRCLEKDPSKRLASANQVADALPGGDPLAAALALGETPSPEMVAAAGSKMGMKPMYAVACMLAIIVGLVVNAFLRDKASPTLSLSRQNSPDDLTHKARDLTRQVGYTERPADSAFGFGQDFDYLSYVNRNIPAEKQLDQVTKGRSVIVYWYRQSPQYLQSWDDGWITAYDPPRDFPGMVSVWLDLQGRLSRFEAVPPQLDQTHAIAPPPDWKPLFAAAGLDATTFASTEPEWTPLAACDVRAAWAGVHPAQPEIPLRIEAAAYRGKPVYFHLIWPWTKPQGIQTPQTHISNIVVPVILLLVLFGALLLVRYNVRQGRGDRRGAFRLAAFIFSVQLLTWLFAASHAPHLGELYGFFFQGVSRSLLWASLSWLLYIALEPYVRRHWPVVLVSWSRLLSGSLRDPLVSRDLLIGILFGIVTQTLWLLERLANLRQAVIPENSERSSWSGLRFLLASSFMNNLSSMLLLALFILLFLFLLRIITRREWLAAAIFVAFGCWLGSSNSDSPLRSALLAGLSYLLMVSIMLRFGYVAFACYLVISGLLSFPITLHFSAWYTSSAMVVVGAILALTIYAFHTSLGGQKLFAGKLLEE